MKDSLDVPLLRRLRAVSRLAESAADATAAPADLWQYAVPIDVLRNHGGLTNGDLRSLVVAGLVEHRVETTRDRSRKRTFRRNGAMNPATRTCFILSAAGLRQARRICALLKAAPNGSDEKPRWDAASGNLIFGAMLAMHVPERAKARREIFAAAEAAGWNNPINSPFADMPPARRSHYLRRLLDQLNHDQSCLHFSSANKGRQFLCIKVEPS